MCTHVLLLSPITADVAAVLELANAHGFRASANLWPGESTRLGAMRVFDPSGSTCDCATPIGSALRAQPDRQRLERESRDGARRRWSAERRRKWIEQRVQAAHRAKGVTAADAEAVLAPWCALAEAAAADPRVERIGVLVREPDARTEDLHPTETAPATVAAMLRIARHTPTWLVPAP